jgi:hypothetical protein
MAMLPKKPLPTHIQIVDAGDRYEFHVVRVDFVASARRKTKAAKTVLMEVDGVEREFANLDEARDFLLDRMPQE